ncbi:LuxR C-terminal-related transcriptional regulator [Sporosarcina sp. FSL K6-2383]|uniref:LuxR C-terminal-related transcriptional regulator n=1 Tax=Sporosarcina sp. FSL K6-2383 TaxID=2921556 RepID=UPI00315A49F3
MEMVCLNSKITVPRVALEAVERQRLFDLLHNDSKKLTIVRAPAGYGKTTLLSHWFSQFDDSVAWLSIDTADNDPMRFWRYIIHTVADVTQRDVSETLLPLFNLQPQLPLELLVDTFLNELDTIPGTVQIVMDDYHLIDNDTIHEMMTRFIDYLPNNVHMYMTSRAELPLPITKWRVKSWLSEIGKEQLRFTYEDIKRFYEKKNLDYKDADVLRYVLNQTEGWAAGIQLIGLTIDMSKQNNRIVDLPHTTHPFITEFLLNEILAILPLDIQDFLVRTSLLNLLDPAICNTLTNRSDSDAVLLELEKKGLFIVRLHSSQLVFRYHHMFMDALQIELQNRYSKDKIALLYKETATLLYEKRDVHTAIELALANGFYEIADTWIAAHIVELFESGQTSTFLRWVQTLLNNKYVVQPETLVMSALMLTIAHKLTEARQLLSDLEQRQTENQWMNKVEYENIARSYKAVKAYALIASGEDIEQATEIIREKLHGGFVDAKWDALSLQYNRFEPKILHTSIGSRGKLWSDEKSLPFFELLRQSEFNKQNMTGFSYGLRAETLYERNRVDEAWTELKAALKYGHTFQDPGLLIPMYLLQARMYMTKKQFTNAYTLLDHALDSVKESHWIRPLFAMKAYGFLIEGDIALAEAALYNTTNVNNRKAESGQAFWLLVHIRILLAKKLGKDALLVIIQVKEKALQEQQISILIEATVLEASCQLILSDDNAALEALHEALEYGAPYYYVRTFLDEITIISLFKKYVKVRKNGVNASWNSVPLSYIEQLLAHHQDDYIGSTEIDVLTPREQDVLKLLASGAANIEIASQLALSEGTVRIYLSRIYSKLGVNSRTQAVLLAKEWEE